MDISRDLHVVGVLQLKAKMKAIQFLLNHAGVVNCISQEAQVLIHLRK